MTNSVKRFFAAIVLAGAIPAFAQTAMPRLAIPTAESNGMGGTHIAYTDNVFSLLVNPAAMMRVGQVRFAPLSFTLYSPQTTFGLIDAMTGAASGEMEALGDAADILSKQKGKIVTGFGLNELPLSFAWVADGFGFGVWQTVSLTPAIVGTNILLDANVDMIFPVGFAFRIFHTDSHDVDAGITVKPFVRALISERLRILDLMMDEDNDIADSFSVPLLIGAGLDLGFMYRWDMGLSAALTLSDIVTRGGVATDFVGNASDTYYVPFSMNWGLAYNFRPERFWPDAHRFFTESGVVFAVDWRDFTNVFQQKDYMKRNASLDIGLGLEFSIIDIFKIRLGMNECLPAFGVGFDLGPVELDFAYYGRELGLEPGQLPVAAISLTFAVRPEAKPRSWPWTRRSLVGLITGKDEPDLAPKSQKEEGGSPETLLEETEGEEAAAGDQP